MSNADAVDPQAVRWIAEDVAAQTFGTIGAYWDDLERSPLFDEAFKTRLRASLMAGWNLGQYRRCARRKEN